MNSRGSHADRPRAGLAELTDRLRRQARRVTGPREAVLELLRRQDHPLSSQEVFSLLPAGGCDLATVYRSLHLLERMGMVQRFDLGDGIGRYELLRDGDDGHHHHLVCTRCATVVEIETCLLAEMERHVAERNGYKSITHRLEFFGLCPRCQ